MHEGCVVITGASGLLGRALLKTFLDSNRWTSVLGTAFSRSGENLVKLDLTDFEATKKFITEFKPKFLVHAAAQRFPDKMEKDPDASRRLNVEATKILADAMKSIDGRIIYISTDYVFDGKNPPYSIEDTASPLNLYGQSKLDGEKVVLETDPRNMVLRIPILYGDVEYLDESAITTLFKLLLNPPEKDTKISDYEIRRPSSVKDISSVVEQLANAAAIQQHQGCVGGIFQWCGEEPMTKYQMVQTMAEIFGLDGSRLIADKDPSPGALRPYDTTMSCERLTSLGIRAHTPFKVGIEAALSKWRTH